MPANTQQDAFDTDTERYYQAVLDALRADEQLCPCHCENCPLRAAAVELDSETGNKKTAHQQAVSSVSFLTMPEGAEAGPVT